MAKINFDPIIENIIYDNLMPVIKVNQGNSEQGYGPGGVYIACENVTMEDDYNQIVAVYAGGNIYHIEGDISSYTYDYDTKRWREAASK